nr:hypothetical protein [Tissierella sp.]
MKYKNENYRKIKGSHILLISCGSCKSEIARYQKLGKGSVLRMYVDRVIESTIDLKKDFICPNCNKLLGSKVSLKKDKKEFYKMIRSTFNSKKE